MAYKDFREFLAALETDGRLRRITVPVDPAGELSCMARWMYQALPEERRFALLFEKLRGVDGRLVTAALGASRQTYALALGVAPDLITERWVQALCRPIAPVDTTVAPCQELVTTGADVDLGRLPVPVWTPGKDAAPYLTTLTLTRDADSGIQNLAVYRTMVAGKDKVLVNLSPGRHGTRCWQSYLRQGRPAPIAWAIGCEPAVHMAAVANVPYGVDEMTIAGGLKGEPIALVKAKTIDLMVPANAEYIIEGEIRPGEFDQEGPFGEFAGYMGPVASKPVATITAITCRRDPIYYGYVSQMPPSESTIIQSLGNAGLMLKQLRHDLGHASVRDVHIDLTYGGVLAHGIVAMKPLYPGHAKQVGRLVADLSFLKRVTVVDEDVDIRDAMHMDWALNARYNPRRDTVIVDDVFCPADMDPAVPRVDGKPGINSKIVIDATEKTESGTFSLPPAEDMDRALALWKEAGLPSFDIPKRCKFMLSRG